MKTRNILISTKADRFLSFALCSASTNSFSCISFPVFSGPTNDGTTRYEIDTPLKQLSPPGNFRTSNNPTVSYSTASGTGTITFTYGGNFDPLLKEYEATSTPRRYKYFLHRSSYSPGTAYLASIASDSNVLIGGTINILAGPVTATSLDEVCSIEVT